jgi:DNA-3-methyladenine glycosylase
MSRLTSDFYRQDAVTVAEKLLGKILVRVREDGTECRYTISETEAYLGEEDMACHASKGVPSVPRSCMPTVDVFTYT